MTAADKYKEFKKTYEEARKQLSEQAGQAFKEMAKELFERFPTMESFSWNQYTPYFDDGDECVFRVNSDAESISINGLDGYDVEQVGYDGKTIYNPGAYPEGMSKEDSLLVYDAVAEFLNQFDDEILLDLYGNHSTITIHRNGKAEVETYDHD